MEVRIDAIPFDPELWSPFGWVPVSDTDPADGKMRLDFAWSDVHLNLISHTAEEVPWTDKGVSCEMLFRHLSHTQALLVLNGPCVIAVAPPEVGFDHAGDAAEIRAFLLQPHDALVLHRGTWHWGPFPVGHPRVELYNVQGLRYAEDNGCVKLADLGASVEIALACVQP
jgi:ureidoglycolate hydrolase